MTSASREEHTPAYQSVGLDTCDREPIHVPGAIQPHGVLVAVDEVAHRAVSVSRNAAALLGAEAESQIGESLARILGDELAAAILDRATGARAEPFAVLLPDEGPVTGLLAGRWVEIAVHLHEGVVIVEIEPLVAEPASLSHRSARVALARLITAETVSELADVVAGEIRDASGFDGVMVYRFDEEWNGEVIVGVADDRWLMWLRPSSARPWTGAAIRATPSSTPARATMSGSRRASRSISGARSSADAAGPGRRGSSTWPTPSGPT